MNQTETYRVVFIPGNGHVDERLDPARREIAATSAPMDLVSVNYGEHDSYDELLDSVRDQVADADIVYATGIGGLVFLSLRARGDCPNERAILQGPVLWGLETRRFPKIMRAPLMPLLLTLAIRTGPIQGRFMGKHFRRALDPDLRRAFFRGYRDPKAFERWFGWLTPSLLRYLEGRLRGQQALVGDIEAWWGGEDHVVGLEELRLTEAALGVHIPVRTFDHWGHYPMIDDPEHWVQEVVSALAPAP